MSINPDVTPANTLDTKDPGDDVQRRFRYQAAYAAILSLALLDENSEFEEVFCEHLTHALKRFVEQTLEFPHHYSRFVLATITPCIQEIEEAYLEALLQIGVPGISENDRVEIRRTTWMPMIVPEEGDAYNFYNAGSGGKKTLLNVCYALAVHKIAAEHGLPLPTFLMIDTPMKNIGEDVNREIFENFYHYLYDLATGSLSNTQFIIIDKEYFPPDRESERDVMERYMEPGQPLISYYRGP